MFADMIVIVEAIVTVVEQRYDLYSWCMLLVDGGSRILQSDISDSQGRDVDAPRCDPTLKLSFIITF